MEMSKNFKELERSIYSCIEECREEMKHHYHRFVQLEKKFHEMTDSLIYLQMEITHNAEEVNDEKKI